MAQNPIICALDTTDPKKALELTISLKNYVGGIKLGLEFFVANGPAGVKAIEKAGVPIFLDLKFHDIPNTVAGAVRAIGDLNVFMTTIHVSGGRAMMAAAAEAAAKLPNKPIVVGVTVLTSLDDDDLTAVGIPGTASEQVATLATLAKASGLNGVVCSSHEIGSLKQVCGSKFKLVVPGIRPEGSATGDQKRTMTPQEALKLGADYLVIGRPITQAKDPQAAAEAISKSL